ncbi:hypothetical protein XGA_3588 [Xanthomonas hortorum ATCC 19865]|nr:hypothetical protein XGA_3588 [Xanthomonas hortorum ATCC 19865]
MLVDLWLQQCGSSPNWLLLMKCLAGLKRQRQPPATNSLPTTAMQMLLSIARPFPV